MNKDLFTKIDLTTFRKLSNLKKILIALILFLSTQNIFSQDFKITRGTILKYKYVREKAFYRLYITIKEISPDVSFDWVLLGYNCSSGSVTIKKDASDCANGFCNYFKSEDTTLLTTTSIRMSNPVYSSLKKKGEAKMIPEKSENTFKLLNGKNYDFTLDGKNIKVNTLFAQSVEDAGNKIWVYDNKDFPLVLAMNMGMSLELYEASSCPDCSFDNKVKAKELESIVGKSWNDPDIFSLLYAGNNSCSLEPGLGNWSEVKWGRSINHDWTTLNYKCFEKGVHLEIDDDTLKKLGLYNEITDLWNADWKQYKGPLPFGLNFEMTRQSIEKLLGAPDSINLDQPMVIYNSRKLTILYSSKEPNSAIISYIELGR